MTVAQLIALLQTYPQDADVVVVDPAWPDDSYNVVKVDAAGPAANIPVLILN